MSGLFGTIGIANSGLNAQQAALNVTSHNIANAGTNGYSRQVANIVTAPAQNSIGSAGQIGTGVQVASITRVTDDFLNYQTRTQNGVLGAATSQDQVLSQVENIINEPSTSGLSTALSTFYNSFATLSQNPNDAASKQAVASASSELADGLNSAYSQLQDIKTSTNTQINNAVTDVNSILTQLNAVNTSIVQITATGQQPNDLLDTRDNLIDQLSSDLGINVVKQSNGGENIATTDAAGNSVSDSTPAVINLVQFPSSNTSATLSYVSNIAVTNPSSYTAGQPNTYTVTYNPKGDTSVPPQTLTVTMTDAQADSLGETRVILGDNNGIALNSADSTDLTDTPGTPIQYSSLQVLTTPTGAIQGYGSAQTDVDSDIDQLNSFAKGLALSVNAIETQSSVYTADGTPTGVAANPADTAGSYNMFVNADPAITGSYTAADENNITAGNITLDSNIANDSAKIITGETNDPAISGTDDGTRTLAIANLQNSALDFQNMTATSSRSDLLTSPASATVGNLFAANSSGVFTITSSPSGTTTDQIFNNLVDNIGIKEQSAQTTITNQTTLLANYATSKASVSGVSLDEEMSNLVLFQHAYEANAKMISTVDQLLDVVINGLMSSS